MNKIAAILLFPFLLFSAAAFARETDADFHWGYDVSDNANYPTLYIPDEAPNMVIGNLTAEFRVTDNPLSENVVIYLPLPADNPLYQRILAYQLTPKPKRILTSRYGYKIALYDFGPLPPGAMISIRYHAQVELYKVHVILSQDMVGTLDEIPEQIRKDYTRNAPYYRINDPYIQASARAAVGDAENVLEQVRRIWLYVRNRLYYRGDGRKDVAAQVLRQGHGSCTEYTFSIIALLRARGIPARYMSGSITHVGPFARTSRDTIFHKIMEVYIPRIGWIPVESTAGGRYVNEAIADEQIGRLRPRMFFYIHEPEPGLAPLDPRRNTFTYYSTKMGTHVGLVGQVLHTWERVKMDDAPPLEFSKQKK